MSIHPRNARYKERVLSAPYEICVERARWYTASYRQTEGRHPALRAAKAFAHTLANMTVYILDEEQIVGNRSSKLVGAVLPVERGDINTVIGLELDALLRRDVRPFHIAPEDRRELMEDILPYWRGQTVRDGKKALWRANGLVRKPAVHPVALWKRLRSLDMGRLLRAARPAQGGPVRAFRSLREVLYNNPAFLMNVFDVQGHLVLGHHNVIREGFLGIRSRAERRLQQAGADGDAEGVAFLEAVVITCDAMRDFAARFATEAERVASVVSDDCRRDELIAIADRCRRVPFHPPRDFREAVQALWFTQVGAHVAYGMGGIFAIGRFDQYLYPFYARDQSEGRISDDEVRALLEELLIKLSYNLLMLPSLGKTTGSELGSDSCATTIGGLDPDGRNAVNELSYRILEAFANVRSLGNSFAIRLSAQSPDAFWRRAIETHRHTSGAALFCDEVVVKALKRGGIEARDALDYAVIGCVEPTSSGNTFGCTSGNDVSLVAALEMALLDGYLRIMGKRIGPRTGDPRTFSTFDEFLLAFKRQVAFMVETVVRGTNLKDRVYQERFPNPYVSATLSGCIERARDMTAGGARYNFGSVGARGFGTVVDSLAAIKHFVYEHHTLSMDALIRALNRNFRGEERLRALLANKAPKFGCDDPLADAIAQEVAAFFCQEVSRHATLRGGHYRPGFFSYGMHVLDGLFLGATPNGRRAGEPVSNSFSPSNGSERKGPTALLRSVARVDHTLIGNGCAVNVKLMPSMFKKDDDLDRITALVKSYFTLGGMELQLNVVSDETLREAQRHPEEYRDLVVRVSGYSAYFTDLGQALQEDIIRRTTFGGL